MIVTRYHRRGRHGIGQFSLAPILQPIEAKAKELEDGLKLIGILAGIGAATGILNLLRRR